MSAPARPSAVRIALGLVALAGIAYGLVLLFDDLRVNRPFEVIKWAIAADIVVDGIILPATILVGTVLTLTLPPRVRRYVQGALIVMGVVTLVALPLIHRRGDSQPGQALLLQDYAVNLAILLGVVVGAAALAYVAHVVRDQTRSGAIVRPDDAETPPIE